MASYRLHLDADLGAEFRRVAHDQLVRGLAELDGDDLHHGVHQVRKRCKKLRALVRLLHTTDRQLARRENAAFRDTAKRIAELRDVAALVEAVDFLRDGADAPADALAGVRAGLVARRDASTATPDAEVAAVRAELTAALDRVAGWELPDAGFDLLAGGLARTYRRGRRDLARVHRTPTTEAFHEWRKRVKDHRYQVRLVQDSWPRVLRARRRELHRLGELLGTDHDLAGLEVVLAGDPRTLGGQAAVAAARREVTSRRAALQGEALALGARVYAEPADAFVARIAEYWRTTQDRG